MTGRARASGRPTLRDERALHRDGFALVAGMDEVGRGALAGPVSVGVVVVAESTPSAPTGVRDSKLLLPAVREALEPRIRRWAFAHGVGHAGPDEIDAFGILAALRLAGLRALASAGVVPDVVILDGKHDWLTWHEPAAPEPDALFEMPAARPVPSWPDVPTPSVRTRIKADMACSSVAAASVLAKVERDAAMVALAERHPQYGWHVNKGYAAPEHRAALIRHGACELHRRSWRLFGPTDEGLPADPPADMGENDPVKGRLT